MPPVSHVAASFQPARTCYDRCENAVGAAVFLPAGALPAQVSTTAPTSVATDGLSGFTLGAALLVVLVAGYYLLQCRRTSDTPE